MKMKLSYAIHENGKPIANINLVQFGGTPSRPEYQIFVEGDATKSGTRTIKRKPNEPDVKFAVRSFTLATIAESRVK